MTGDDTDRGEEILAQALDTLARPPPESAEEAELRRHRNHIDRIMEPAESVTIVHMRNDNALISPPDDGRSPEVVKAEGRARALVEAVRAKVEGGGRITRADINKIAAADGAVAYELIRARMAALRSNPEKQDGRRYTQAVADSIRDGIFAVIGEVFAVRAGADWRARQLEQRIAALEAAAAPATKPRTRVKAGGERWAA